MVESLTIRLAWRDDLQAMVALLADDELGAARECFADPLPEVYARAFETIEKDPNNELVVVEAAGEILGCLQVTYIPHLVRRGSWRAQVEGVRVHRNARGQGVGRALFEWVRARARQRGCHLLQLTTDKSRADAHRFYENLGFAASHEGMKLKLEA